MTGTEKLVAISITAIFSLLVITTCAQSGCRTASRSPTPPGTTAETPSSSR